MGGRSAVVYWRALRRRVYTDKAALRRALRIPPTNAQTSAGLEKALAQRAASRKLDNLTVGPVLSVTTETMMKHTERLLQIPGAGPGGWEAAVQFRS